MRVGVLIRHPLEKQAAPVEIRDEILVGVLEELTADQRHLSAEMAVRGDRVHHREVVGPADGHVVGAERWGKVHDPRAVAGCDEIALDHVVRGGNVHEVEGRSVVHPLQVRAGQAVQDLGVLAKRGPEQILGDDQGLPILVGHNVGCLCRDGHRCVRDQGPRSGRPHEQRDAWEALGEIAVGDLAGHEDRGINHCLVALGQFMVAEGGPAARAVGGDAVVLLQQSLVENRLQ